MNVDAAVDQLMAEIADPLLLQCGHTAILPADNIRVRLGSQELWCTVHHRWESRVNA